jgi:hypothetical protein
VIVAVTIMWMVKMPSDQVVNVIAMRDCLMATAWTMNVYRFMVAAVVTWSAGSRVLFAD